MSRDVEIPQRSVRHVVDDYDGVLLDSYGVLVDGAGALPGARALLESLDAAGRPWMVVSNDASRSVESAAARYARLSLPIPPERILVSAAMLAGYYAREGLSGARSIVLGTEDSVAWVRQAGGIPVPWDDEAPEVVVACDDDGFPFVPAVEAVLSSVVQRVRAGHEVALALPNPDLVYPRGGGALGLTAGSVALVIEASLGVVFGDVAPRFVPLGKPEPGIFEEACRRLGVGGSRVVMLGDQFATDVAGALRAGLSAALVGTGVTTLQLPPSAPRPTFILPSLVD